MAGSARATDGYLPYGYGIKAKGMGSDVHRHAIGVSPLLGYQRFRAEGLQTFSQMSGDSSKLSKQGYDSCRVSKCVWAMYVGQPSEVLTLGVRPDRPKPR